MKRSNHSTIILCAVSFCTTSAFGQIKDSCDRWHAWVGIGGQQPQYIYVMQYDTLRRFIESCAKTDPSPHDAFTGLNFAVSGYAPDDTTRYERYRNWLISVLYLNTTDPFYFCACLESIAETYQYYPKYSKTAGLAVYKYLLSIPACNTTGLQYQFTTDSIYDQNKGYGTEYPPLDSIGLGFLLHKAGIPTVSGIGMQYLASFTTRPNPFTVETSLNFTLNRMAYTQLAIYDVLGRLIWGDGRGSSLEAGEHTVHIDGKDLPSGMLYARISTGFGEVQTVKLVHEK